MGKKNLLFSSIQINVNSQNYSSDVRAKLEIAIDKVINTTRLIYTDDDDSTSSDSEEVRIIQTNVLFGFFYLGIFKSISYCFSCTTISCTCTSCIT